MEALRLQIAFVMTTLHQAKQPNFKGIPACAQTPDISPQFGFLFKSTCMTSQCEPVSEAI